MDDELKRIAIESKLDNLYKNSLFSIRSICEHLNIWNEYSEEEKHKLQNLTARDTKLNKNFEYKGGYDDNLAYGEIKRTGVEKLISEIIKIKKDLSYSDVFVDIGSGSGKLLIHAALRLPIKTFVGIEMVEQRNLYAKNILSKFEPIEDKKVFFINKDVRDFDLSIAKIVFCNNVCFSDNLVEKIYDKLPVGCHIITAKKVNSRIFKDSFTLDVSWIDRPFEFRYYIK